jgi:cell division protein FtsB
MDLRLEHSKKVRLFPLREGGLRSLVNHAPQAEALAGQVMDRIRPHASALYLLRRKLATTAVVLLTGWLFAHVMFGANGMVVYRQKRAEYQNLQKELTSLQKENDRYTSQIKGLKTDPKLIEKIAREQLHYTKPGEYVLVNPARVQPPLPDTHAARK